MPLSDRIDLDEVPPSFRPFAKAILRQDDPGSGLIQLLGTLGEKAPGGESRDFALLLRRTLPQSARLDRVSDVYIRGKYPLWYIRAVNDRHRNAAYRRALQALVTPETLVVEFKFNRDLQPMASTLLQGFPLRVSRHSKYINGALAIQSY